MTTERHDPEVQQDRPLHTPDEEGATTIRVQLSCKKCGTTFEGTQTTVLGISLSSSVCEPCAVAIEAREKEQAEQARERTLKARLAAREAHWLEWCPKEFRLTTEGDGKTDLARLELKQPKLKELLLWTGPIGWVIRGGTGTCKTRSMWRLLRKLSLDGKSFEFLTAAEFERECRDAGGNFTLKTWFKRLATVDIFVMDDLGKAPWSPATESSWFDLVDTRGREDRPIFVTTNDTGTSLKSRMAPERAEPLIRRLRDYCDQVTFL